MFEAPIAQLAQHNQTVTTKLKEKIQACWSMMYKRGRNKLYAELLSKVTFH